MLCPCAACTCSCALTDVRNPCRRALLDGCWQLAREAGLDITRVAGTGPNSRVVAADVEEYLANPPVEEDTDTSFASDSAAAAAPSADAAAYARGEFQDIPHTAMRRVIAERLTEAKRTVPHYYLTADVDIGELMKLRAQLNQQLDTKLSVNDFIIKASALALRQVPAVNSSWLESGVRAYDYVDVSVAVAVEEGTCPRSVVRCFRFCVAWLSLVLSHIRPLPLVCRPHHPHRQGRRQAWAGVYLQHRA